MSAVDSILNSIKKLHGIPAEDSSFDPDLTMYINSVFTILTQLGIGPVEGFYIEDQTTLWSDFVQDRFITESIRTFMYVKVRLMFDPPASPTMVEALNAVAKEQEWRILQRAENNI